jgi:transposase InsO family protein
LLYPAHILPIAILNLCGVITPPTPGGRRYFLLLVDAYSRFMWLVLLSTKDEAAAELKRFQAESQTEARRPLRTLRTDRGGEFTSSPLAAHFADTGIRRHLTTPYTPQQNSVVERRNQTVVGMARSMMKAKKLPNFFWGEAVTTEYTRSIAPTVAASTVRHHMRHGTGRSLLSSTSASSGASRTSSLHALPPQAR